VPVAVPVHKVAAARATGRLAGSVKHVEALGSWRAWRCGHL